VSSRRARSGLLLCLVLGVAAAHVRADPWPIPPPGGCQPADGLKGWPIGVDAPPLPFDTGDSFALDQMAVLEGYLPPEIWKQRERFFYEGMRLEIGPCFADYSPPAFFDAATKRFAGKAKLRDNGGLADYQAGLPFVPASIDPRDTEAGLKWAWNVANRYQGAGFRGRFRVSDMVGRAGRAEPFEGEIFKIQLAHRADRPKDRYRAKGARNKAWVAGGKFFTPFAAREHAWRQYRDLSHETKRERSDDLHAYLPDHRRVRRLSAADVEGLYMPSFSVGVVQATTLTGLGGMGSVGSAATSLTTKRSGFEGLEIRPLLYSWKVLGVQDVLSPINSNTPVYPEQKEGHFGTWGLSFASDRWDLRRALVLEGRSLVDRGERDPTRMLLYVDLQTLSPLYYMSYDARDEVMDVGQYVGRWSEARPDYPPWPDDAERPVRVIDSVAAAYANLAEGGGWRRESWDVVATPPSDREVKKLLSVSNLTKGR